MGEAEEEEEEKYCFGDFTTITTGARLEFRAKGTALPRIEIGISPGIGHNSHSTSALSLHCTALDSVALVRRCLLLVLLLLV